MRPPVRHARTRVAGVLRWIVLAICVGILPSSPPAAPTLRALLDVEPRLPAALRDDPRAAAASEFPAIALADVDGVPGLELCLLWEWGAVQVLKVTPGATPALQSLGWHIFPAPSDAAAAARLAFGRFAGVASDALFVLYPPAPGGATATLDVLWAFGATGFGESARVDDIAAEVAPLRDMPGFAYFDFVQDVTGDGLGDLLVAGAAGPRLYVQSDDARFVEAQLPALPIQANYQNRIIPLGARADEPPAADAPPAAPRPPGTRLGRLDASSTLTAGPLAIDDYNADGRPDLLALLPGQIRDADGREWLARLWLAGEPAAGRWDLGAPRDILLAARDVGNLRLLDLNGDGAVDLLGFSSNLDIAAPRTRLTFFDGARQGRVGSATDPSGPLVFRAPTQTLRTRDAAGLCLIADVNRDGRRDVVVSSFGQLFGSVSDLVDALLAEDVDFTLQVHLASPDGLADQPAYRLDLAASMKVFEQGVYPTFIVGGDFDGDGLEEVVVRRREKSFAVYSLAQRGVAVASATIDVASRYLAAEVADLDGDGRDDLLLADPSGAWLKVCLFK